MRETLIQLLQDAQEAHHQAFLEQDGHDPEWPLWYADYLIPHLRLRLSEEITKSELVYCLLWATYHQAEQAPQATWSEFTTDVLLDRYQV